MSNAELEKNSYLFSANAAYIEELFDRYQKDPSSVDESWQRYFATEYTEDDKPFYPSWAENTHRIIGQVPAEERAEITKKAKDLVEKANGSEALSSDIYRNIVSDTIKILYLVRAYRVRGHLIADLDPLQQEPTKYHPDLDPKSYGFTETDMDREFYLDGVLGDIKTTTLRSLLETLRTIYSNKIGVEYMHIQHPEQRAWIQKRIEERIDKPKVTLKEKHQILDTLIEVESFEEFLQVKYPGVKRFSIQGGDAAIAGLEVAISRAAKHRVREIIVGMPHRGRLNVLTTIMGKPYAEMLSLFHGNLDFPEWMSSSGDVKYHLGASSDREFEDGHKMHLSLAANPSHLEAVNPVVNGKVRAKMDQYNDEEMKVVMGVLLHGDAAFAGQGSVAEALALSELKGYRTGGSLHVIVNNQIGFTTSPKFSRFTPYPSDVAKAVQAPIFHVNGEDPEAVAYAFKLAVDFRQEFHRDVVVDVICYRKYGHNESDEPMFTQPLMYKVIRNKKSPATIYAEKLKAEGIVTQKDIDQEYKEYREFFEKQYEISKDFKPNKADWLEGHWAGFERPETLDRTEPQTGVDEQILKKVGRAISSYPSDFNINRKLARILKARGDAIESGKNIDWASAEALAFGTLLLEGHAVRLSGQDCGRGTFSQRHSVLVDQEDASRYVPLNNINGKKSAESTRVLEDSIVKQRGEGQNYYEVIDSFLSELAVLGFEYGYSLAEPNALTIWEAQFGDFSNGAQIIIDQFISSGEVKWFRMSGLVMLLPHGYEGQGPEHSSARIERYLQLCAEDNMQVVNCTTPANFFHVLRRQLHNNFRKPLVVFTPKSLLRHKRCVSNIEDMTGDTSFKKTYGEEAKLVADSKIRKVLITSGKVYYDILEEREKQNIKDIAIIRLEQYYPFPHAEMVQHLKRYKNAKICWAQEEPKNMGAWSFVRPMIEDVMDEIGRGNERILYAGRPAAASPATGYAKIHEKEQAQLVAEALA